MTFDELLDITPNVRVADIIQLFLLGHDDKIYINIMDAETWEYLLTGERIISGELVPYYDEKILWIEEEAVIDDMGFLTLAVKRRVSHD